MKFKDLMHGVKRLKLKDITNGYIMNNRNITIVRPSFDESGDERIVYNGSMENLRSSNLFKNIRNRKVILLFDKWSNISNSIIIEIELDKKFLQLENEDKKYENRDNG